MPTEYPGFPAPMAERRQEIEEILGSINAYTEDYANVLDSMTCDIKDPQSWLQFSATPVQGVICINILHISDISVARGLFEGSGQVLAPKGHLFIYEACKFSDGPAVPESNEAFDAKLKEFNPAYGLRNVHDLDGFASENKLKRVGTHERPANNYVLVYEKE